MVGVDNSRSRYKEYRGWVKPADGTNTDNSKFDAYATFLTKELKPKIDRDYRTLKTPANTGIMGSSLGGICSLALAWDNPRVFGRVASLSGSFHIEKRNFLERVLNRR